MQRPAGLLLWAICAALAATSHAGTSAVAAEGRVRSRAAVQKVIQLLADMSAKGTQAKNDEEVAFAKFSTWCKHEVANLQTDIKKGASEIERLETGIGKLTSDIDNLGEGVADLQSDEATYEAERQKKKVQREKSLAIFKEEETDFKESVSAVERAIKMLSKQNYDRPAAAASLLQVSSLQRLPEQAQSIVAAFVEMLEENPQDPMDYQAPEANAYEFQSGGIVDMLKKLRDDFREKLETRQKEEMNSRHASEMIQLDLTDAAENAKQEAGEKASSQDRKKAKKAQSEKQLSGERAVTAESVKSLKETSAECQQEAMSFKEKQQLRGEELEAIAKASEIMTSSDVTGNAEKHLALAQAPPAGAAAALLQAGTGERLATHRRRRDDESGEDESNEDRVADFLETESKRLRSKRLALLAEKVAITDPFVKVKHLIDGMITRLLEEANEDAKHEGFCDEEMGKSKITRTKLTESVEGLTAAIDETQASVIRLKEGTAQLTKEVAELQEANKEATQMRTAEKAKNQETVADAEAASKAVAAAIAVLKDFYSKSGETGFVQVKNMAPDRKRIKMGTDEWDSLGTSRGRLGDSGGQQASEGAPGEAEAAEMPKMDGSGVLGLLEIIASDFGTLKAETSATEEAAAESYRRFIVQSKKSSAIKERKIEMNSSDKAEAEAKVQDDIRELESTKDELKSAERYHKELVPQCLDKGMSWDQRVKAREAEIESLKEALRILTSEDVA